MGRADPDFILERLNMAERELRRMSRTELIEIIYALKQHEEELKRRNAELEQKLADRTLRLERAGSIAEAALELNHVFEAAQAAADAYLDSVRAMVPPAPPAQPAENGGADTE